MSKKGEVDNAGQLSVTILLAEYRAMYDLALFRLSSLDRRVPLTGSALVAMLGAALMLPPEAKLFILIALPPSLVWFLRTTINHARSFEDALRRIEEIEHALNAAVGSELVDFQSKHPSRGRSTGGRTGGETIVAVIAACMLILLGCGSLALTVYPKGSPALLALLGYKACIAAYLVAVSWGLRRYRYRKSPDVTSSSSAASSIAP